MARIRTVALSIVIALCTWADDSPAQGVQQTVVDLRVVVDDDDDNGNGIPDGRETADPVDTTDCARLSSYTFSAPPVFRGISPDPTAVRVLVDGRLIAPGAVVPASASKVSFQAIRPGRFDVDLGSLIVRISAVQIFAVDGAGRVVDLTRSHASFQRQPPDRLEWPTSPAPDSDALRYVLAGLVQDLPESVRVMSRSAVGAVLDSMSSTPLVKSPCPAPLGPSITCRSTWPIRVVGDQLDRVHPVSSHRSLRADLGGAIVIAFDLTRQQQIRVGGPRNTRWGAVQRYRSTLRLTLVRSERGGLPPIGSHDVAAMAIAREQVEVSNALWAQCGISFGSPDAADVRIMDPPPPFLLAIGCDHGVPGAGGKVSVRVDGREIMVPIHVGDTPHQVARRVARAVQARGLKAILSPNAAIHPGVLGSVDVLVYRANGKPASWSALPDTPVSSDPNLGVCIGEVFLTGGLRHFSDMDSMAGTVEERTLLKYVDDLDPATLDIVFVSAFAKGGRIGESFLGDERSALRNMIVLDRAGVRVGRASFTLAHELGHVILDVPGHSDDYGVDTPSLLMDSDAADPTAFGPRRLQPAECERALQQSGPFAPIAILTPWPWKALPKAHTPRDLR